MTHILETFADGVHAVAVGTDLAILDTRRDAYLCLPEAAGALVAGERGLAVLPGAVADHLRSSGLLGPRTLEAPAAARLPVRTIIHDGCAGRLRVVRDGLPALGVWRDIRRARAVPGLTGFLGLVPGASARRDPDAVTASARRFWRISPGLPVEGECLVRSAMLVSWLGRHGLRADWVFGVRLWPFSAHCWVQCEDVCLNDDFERLAAYTPILVT